MDRYWLDPLPMKLYLVISFFLPFFPNPWNMGNSDYRWVLICTDMLLFTLLTIITEKKYKE